VGVLSREFFERSLGRMGGFGFAARTVARTLEELDGVEPILLSGAALGPDRMDETRLESTRLVFGTGNRARDAWRWRRLGLDVILTIDWHSSFVPVARALPKVPTIVWSRDPRSEAEWTSIASLRIPGDEAADLEPPGAAQDDGLARVLDRSRRSRRPVRFAFTDEFLVERFTARFGLVPPEAIILGTPVDPPRRTVEARVAEHPDLPAAVRAGEPFTVYLGRLDPIKRPWVYAALAEAVPEMHFVALGQQHLEGGWRPEPAANLHWLGHVDGPVKQALLDDAVATVNTSIHEAVPLSLLESLHHATPVVACLELGGLTARFGVAVPAASGDGMAAVPALATGLRALLADAPRRRALGTAGQSWVRARHSRSAFVGELGRLLRSMDVEVPSSVG
jgi:glycosyltransferase involved in cell wall biosynthesis